MTCPRTGRWFGGWRKVTKRKPHNFVFVTDGFFQSIAKWMPKQKRWLDQGSMNYAAPPGSRDLWFEPTHWMLLPDRPPSAKEPDLAGH